MSEPTRNKPASPEKLAAALKRNMARRKAVTGDGWPVAGQKNEAFAPISVSKEDSAMQDKAPATYHQSPITGHPSPAEGDA